METIKKKSKGGGCVLWNNSSVLTPFPLSLGHQRWDAVLGGLLL